MRESHTGESIRLSLTGDLDLASAPELEHRLAQLRATKSPVRLDLSRLAFIDSTGIHLLVRTFGEARLKHWALHIDRDFSPRLCACSSSSTSSISSWTRKPDLGPQCRQRLGGLERLETALEEATAAHLVREEGCATPTSPSPSIRPAPQRERLIQSCRRGDRIPLGQRLSSVCHQEQEAPRSDHLVSICSIVSATGGCPRLGSVRTGSGR
jgi:ABC-type transporter Mla MlaB component